MQLNIHIPLLDSCNVEIYRLSHPSTWAADAPGAEYATGYDPVSEEPIMGWTSGVPATMRRELAPVQVQAQIEVASNERLHAAFGGDAPVSRWVFVVHRRQLRRLGLVDPTTGSCLLKQRDRIARIIRRHGPSAGQTTGFRLPLYIYETKPASWGVGPDGYSLELLYTMEEDRVL